MKEKNGRKQARVGGLYLTTTASLNREFFMNRYSQLDEKGGSGKYQSIEHKRI